MKGSATKEAAAETVDAKTAPREQLARMDAATFFSQFAMLLAGNPPAKDDAPMLDKMKTLVIEAGRAFETARLDPIAARSVEEGAKAALQAIKLAAGNANQGGELRNGWTWDIALGRWGTDYGKRAVAAYNGLGINAPEDAVFLSTHLDSDGHRLDGAEGYVLHFDKGNFPPADGFWSLSLYDEQHHFFANALDRHNIGSDNRFKLNADGSLDIHIQHAKPAADKAANWLPAPKGSFNLILRIYWPKPDVVSGAWAAPAIQRTT